MLALGRAIRTLRAARGLSQRDLARRAALTPSFLSLVEMGKRKPSLAVTGRIAEALDMPTEALFWEAVVLPDDMREDERRICELAKDLVRRKIYEGAATDDSTFLGDGHFS